MVAELIALRATRSHGSHAGVQSAGIATAAASAARTATGTASAADSSATRCAQHTAAIERQFQQQQSNMRGFDNIETSSGSADHWPTRSFWQNRIKTAVSGMNGDLVDILDAAEADRVCDKLFRDTCFSAAATRHAFHILCFAQSRQNVLH